MYLIAAQQRLLTGQVWIFSNSV